MFQSSALSCRYSSCSGFAIVFLSLSRDKQDRDGTLMQEAHHLVLRLLPCCHNEQMLSILFLQMLNEGFRIPFSECRLHRQAGAGTHLFCLIGEKVSFLHFLLRAHLLFEQRWGRIGHQQDRGMTGQRQSARLLEDPFTAHHAIERNHDGLVGGLCYGSGWELPVLWRMQQEQGGWSRRQDISGHASQEQAPAGAASMGRERNQLHVSVLLRIGVDSSPGKRSLHVLDVHAGALPLEAGSQARQVVLCPADFPLVPVIRDTLSYVLRLAWRHDDPQECQHALCLESIEEGMRQNRFRLCRSVQCNDHLRLHENFFLSCSGDDLTSL